MENVVGQEKLVKALESYTIQTAPRTMLFLGEHGCGKHWIAASFAEHLDIDAEFIDKQVTTEKLVEYYQYPLQRLYVIDLTEIDPKQQNKFLKFIEEPSSNMYIILIAESEIGILPTILNRCKKFIFEKYTIDQLKEFGWMSKCSDELMYSICSTPGQIIDINMDTLEDAYNLCETIVTKAPKAKYSNIIKISTKINCGNDFKKIDFDIFFRVLIYVAFTNYKETGNGFSFDLYKYLIERQAKRLNKSIAKESYLLSFLDNLWEIAQRWN